MVKRKGGIKAHTIIKASDHVPFLIRYSEAIKHDHSFLKEVHHLPKDSIITFDKGYVDYAQYEKFTECSIWYVTRLKDNAVYEAGEEFDIPEGSDSGVLKDERITLFYKEGGEEKQHQARRIAYWDSKNERLFEFLTNNMELSAETIALIYKKRWQIELLFKQIKQNFPLKYFLGDNENAIGDRYYALAHVPHGDIRIQNYFSTVTNSWRKVYIYTPPGYDENTDTKYPALYILHGGGEDETGWSKQGKVNLILDNLIAAGKAKPMLIVMPDANISSGGFNADAIENGMKKFEKEVKYVIIPFVEKNYRVKTDAGSRALAGLSMGGIHTLYTGINNTDMFSYLGVFSSGWIVPMMNKIADAQYAFMKENLAKRNNNLKLFWFSEGGPEDIAYKNGQIMLGKLDELKIKHVYYEYPGGHTWPVWRNDLLHFAPLLFR